MTDRHQPRDGLRLWRRAGLPAEAPDAGFVQVPGFHARCLSWSGQWEAVSSRLEMRIGCRGVLEYVGWA